MELGSIEIFYVATADQLADALTKNVPLAIQSKFVQEIGLAYVTS